jgi:hypothetical protein
MTYVCTSNKVHPLEITESSVVNAASNRNEYQVYFLGVKEAGA